MLPADVHVFFLEDISGVFIKMLSIVYNLNKATHILGLQIRSRATVSIFFISLTSLTQGDEENGTC